MDDSKFFELQYKPNKIYALRFTLDNTDKLLQCFYIIFADDSWTIVEKENFNNEYVITDDIEELIYIHKDMEDFKFLGTKSTEITVQIKDK